ncbi:hypothetical protein [Brevibacillus laterosporus]|uniref:Uncharacterized protein n=1 Tax=Brevibacillus laterosporus TaxID=1465 RepID=A0A0F7BYT7_BRELA|nr:hypothetical protein EX87_02120 [Brevibacillus laterosporus]
MKKFFSLVLAVGLLLPAALPGAVSANNVSSAEHISNKTQLEDVLTVKDVIDEDYQKYIDKYKGEFSTYEEVRASANFGDGGTVDMDEFDRSKSKGYKGIQVNDVDEYAALLFYLDDQNNKHTTGKIEKNSGIGAYATREFEEIISDTYISWIKGYVTVTYDKGVITSTNTDSSIYGFHPLNTYTHNSKRSYVDLNSKKNGGKAYIKGTLNLVIFIEGLGTVSTKEINGTISFSI